MKHSRISLFVLAILFSGLVFGPIGVIPERGRAQGTTLVGVFSDTYGSSNVTDASLTPGHKVTFEITVANAPNFNGYEFSLYFDPQFLQFNSSDTRTGTVFANPFLVKEDTNISPGTYRLVVVNNGGTNIAATGTLVHLTFNVVGVGASPLVLAAGTSRPSNYAIDGSWTRLVLGSSPIDVVTVDGYFKNDPVHLGPVASFTFTPPTPTGGEAVTFDASASFDPDNQTGRGIRLYEWDFGTTGPNGGLVTNRTITTHTFGTLSVPFTGNFSVRLTVVDIDNQFEGMITRLVSVAQPVVHDVGIFSLIVLPSAVQAGQDVSVLATVRNFGTSGETYNVTIDFGPPTALLLTQTRQFILVSSSQQFQATLNTAGLSAGAYEVNATVVCQCQDSNPSNNVARTVFIVRSPPTLSLAPDGGTLGTQVLVQGSGFPSSPFGLQLFISFDDQFLGFAFPRNGAFNFTFNVPHADPTKPHSVNAFDLSTGVTTSANFHVLPTPPPSGNLAVAVSAGTIYFPGDTSVIYVQTTLNGSPAGSGVQLQVQLVKPDGSSATLTWVSVTPGLYKATYTVRKTGSTGTYAIVATASLNGQHAAALVSFEVKPPWFASQSGRMTTTGLALAGIVGLVAFASWKGYRGRRREDQVPF